MQKNEVYIIIVTYNGMKWLARCLESTTPYPVIVVDNNSTDGTVDYIKSHYSEIILFEQKENLGFGQANNIGISYALNKGANYVFLLNQDAYLGENCIKRLLDTMNRNENLGIASPIHLDGKSENLDIKFSMYLDRYKISGLVLRDFVLKKVRDYYTLDFINAAGWLISSAAVKKVGFFDEMFFHYGEDRNYCQRILFHGYYIGIVPTGIIRHDRENRVEEKLVKFSDEFYDEFERYIKVNFGDVNLEDYSNKYKNKIKYHENNIIKSFLKLNFQMIKDSKRKLKILKRLKPVLENSRKRNSINGFHNNSHS